MALRGVEGPRLFGSEEAPTLAFSRGKSTLSNSILATQPRGVQSPRVTEVAAKRGGRCHVSGDRGYRSETWRRTPRFASRPGLLKRNVASSFPSLPTDGVGSPFQSKVTRKSGCRAGKLDATFYFGNHWLPWLPKRNVALDATFCFGNQELVKQTSHHLMQHFPC